MNNRPPAPGGRTPGVFKWRWGIATLLLVFAAIAAGIITALPRTNFAHASGTTLSVNPTSWNYSYEDDQPPTTAIGSGYGAKESVKLYFNYTGPNTGTLLTTTTANGLGSFKASFTFLGIVAPAGTYTIAGVGQTTGDVATASFTFNPQIFLRPQAGNPGSTTSVLGYSYAASETVNIYWKYHGAGTGTLLMTATADANGSFTTTITIPSNAKPGLTVTVGAIGQTSNLASSYIYTLYKTTLALAPLSGSPNMALTLSAYGLQASANYNSCDNTGEAVNIFWNNGTVPVTTATTNCFGYLPPTTITVPSGTPPGAYPVSVVGQISHVTITNTFTVVAQSSSLSSSSGPVGATVQVSGQGYGPNETVHILWNYTGPGTGTNIGSITAGRSGTIQGSFTVPLTANGAYTVAARGTSTNRVSQNTFTLANSLAVNTRSASPGQSVGVKGRGYQASESVQLYWDSTSGTALTTAVADANGDTSSLVALPTTATPGAHNLIGVGGTSGQSFTAIVTINTDWGDFGFDQAHHRANPYENLLNTGNVGTLANKWTATTATGLKDSPVYANGTVYIATMDGFLNAYDAITGTVKWQFNCQCGFRSYSSPLVDPAAGLVFFDTVGAADEGIPSAFYAVSTQTGQLAWSVILNYHSVAFPTLAFNTIFVGTSHIDHTESSLYALDELSGGVNWVYVHPNTLPSGFWGAVAADSATNTVFTGVGNPDSSVIAFNATTGAIVWKYNIPEFGADDDVGSGITVDNGLVFASSKNGREYAIHESTGSLAWSTALGASSNGDISTQAVSNGVVYVGVTNFSLVALNESTGAIIWQTRTHGTIMSSIAVANGVVYLGSFDKHIYAVDGSSGTILWTFTTGNIIFSSPVIANGWLYCGSSDGKLYAFSL